LARTGRKLKEENEAEEEIRIREGRTVVDAETLDEELVRKCNNKWDMFFEALELYGESNNGDCNVPQSDISYALLGGWLAMQRLEKQAGRLPSDRLSRLQELVNRGQLDWCDSIYMNCSATSLESSTALQLPPQESVTPMRKWDVMFEALLRYGEQHKGDCNVPTNYISTLHDGTTVCLGVWLAAQRHDRKTGVLKETRVRQLQELADRGSLVWDASKISRQWEFMYEALLTYGAEHEDFNVPPHDPYVKLNAWLGSQRSYKRNGQLRDDRLLKLQLLADTGRFDWDRNAALGRSWDIMFDELLKYGSENGGDCNVTRAQRKHSKLVNWLGRQRQQKRDGCLAEDREKKLQDLVDQGKLDWDGAYSVYSSYSTTTYKISPQYVEKDFTPLIVQQQQQIRGRVSTSMSDTESPNPS